MSSILLIEEISLARFNLKKNLVQMGYNVFDYESSERMFAEAYILEQIDLLIFSANSESECIDFNKRVKGVRHNLPIVFISREFSKETFTLLSKTGAVNFILKPIDYEAFNDRIRSLLPSRMLSITVDDLINSEIARANRGKYSVSVMTVGLEEDSSTDSNNIMLGMFSKLRTDCAQLYRSVDTVFELGNQLMVVLPFTKKDGIPVVIEKMEKHLKDNEGRFPYKVKLGAATYPEECYNAESLLETANSRMLKYNEASIEKLKQKNDNAEKLKKVAFVNSSSELNLKAVNDGGAVKLSWDNIKGAGRYEVNRYNDDILEESKFVYINRYTDNFVKIATAYTYQVRALSKTSQTIAEAHALIFVKR